MRSSLAYLQIYRRKNPYISTLLIQLFYVIFVSLPKYFLLILLFSTIDLSFSLSYIFISLCMHIPPSHISLLGGPCIKYVNYVSILTLWLITYCSLFLPLTPNIFISEIKHILVINLLFSVLHMLFFPGKFITFSLISSHLLDSSQIEAPQISCLLV